MSSASNLGVGRGESSGHGTGVMVTSCEEFAAGGCHTCDCEEDRFVCDIGSAGRSRLEAWGGSGDDRPLAVDLRSFFEPFPALMSPR